jgi:hypothetical protein
MRDADVDALIRADARALLARNLHRLAQSVAATLAHTRT